MQSFTKTSISITKEYDFFDNKYMQTTKQVARDLIKYYVIRGDTFESLKAGRLGSYNSEDGACIGGYIGDKKINPDKIIVNKINGEEILPEVFSLKKIFDEILNEHLRIKAGQQKLL